MIILVSCIAGGKKHGSRQLQGLCQRYGGIYHELFGEYQRQVKIIITYCDKKKNEAK